MIKNIIFDVYGTLISTGTGSVDATKAIFSKYNIVEDADEIYKKWKKIHKENIFSLEEFITEEEIFIKDLEKLFDLYGITDNPRTAIKPMLDSLVDRKLFEETESVINKLSEDYNIAIGSTTDTNPLMHNIEGTSLQRINPIFTSEMLRVYKPNARFYLEILNRTKWKAEECLFVGDSLDDDVIGPMKVGMKPILIDRKKRYVSIPEGVRKIKSLTELCVSLKD
ncbi:HAD family hydrolase [Butyrivibrio sp. M55]|uniref:HAD family hydrolase n=1 Tax=Butyrivibrio sp. M55 TaxID=1855323 RepID=UPI0008E15E5B|nr:HAD family hydrolase [Butyrivibrio sp. M55]SFU75234.1 FMN phosphatase YigB, HAD superfamily [Butyrivibrio sp. M55]